MIRGLTIVVVVVLAGCEGAPESGGMADGTMGAGMGHTMDGVVDTVGLRSLPVPAELQAGRDLYVSSCAACHGEAALGTAGGPPLVHVVYEPNHHADMAFVLAAERGVRAHHWGFGDMPAQPERSRPEVMQIVGYVRWLQRQAGIR